MSLMHFSPKYPSTIDPSKRLLLQIYDFNLKIHLHNQHYMLIVYFEYMIKIKGTITIIIPLKRGTSDDIL